MWDQFLSYVKQSINATNKWRVCFKQDSFPVKTNGKGTVGLLVTDFKLGYDLAPSVGGSLKKCKSYNKWKMLTPDPAVSSLPLSGTPRPSPW